MINFDNAATGGFKPSSVTDAVNSVIKYLSANPGRSSHRLALTGLEIVFGTRKIISELFNADPNRVIFTKNCTEALSTAIFGTIKPGAHVVTTVYEHNSVLRPLFYLKEKGIISLDVLAPKSLDLLPELITQNIRKDTTHLIINAVSNVTGDVLPFEKIGKIAKDNGLIYILDGAQAGGHVHIDVKESNVSALALAGHKGLYGIMGTGVLIVGDGVEVSPLIMGGTGTESFSLSQPTTYPERLESGTLNLPAIAGLLEGVRYVKNNLTNFSVVLTDMTRTLISELNAMPNITCYSKPNPAGIVSFDVKNVSSIEVGERLNKEFDVAVRSGVHCAPLLHKHLKTMDQGLTRVSFSVQNSVKELRYLVKCIRQCWGD